MSETAKTVLIVGGTAVGAFLLIKMLVPAGPRVPAMPRNTDAVSLTGLASFASGLFGSAFGGSSSGTAPQLIDSAGGFLGTRQEWQDIHDYDAQGTPGAPVYGIAGLDF